MMHTFEMNGNAYRTDAQTLAALRSVIPAAKASSDYSAVAAIMHLGLQTGRIVELCPHCGDRHRVDSPCP